MIGPQVTVIAVDPGPIPGVAIIRPDGSVEQLQCTAALIEVVVRALIADAPQVRTGLNNDGRAAVLLAIERFVVGNRSTRSKSPKAGQQTRDMVGALASLGAELGVPVRLRSASEVEPWATCAGRLEAAGLDVKGMPHARSAGWHALFAAVNDAGAPDPLSRSARSPR